MNVTANIELRLNNVSELRDALNAFASHGITPGATVEMPAPQDEEKGREEQGPHERYLFSLTGKRLKRTSEEKAQGLDRETAALARIPMAEKAREEARAPYGFPQEEAQEEAPESVERPVYQAQGRSIGQIPKSAYGGAEEEEEENP